MSAPGLDLTIFSVEDLFLVVPDLHGRSDIAGAIVPLLESLQGKRVVFLGDYIDKTPGSKQVVDMITRARRRHPEWTFLRGNHESLFMHHIAEGTTSIATCSFFEQLSREERVRYAAFFESLPVFLESEHLVFVHGGIHESYLQSDITKIAEEELLWTYGVHPWYRGKKVVRGHDPVAQPTEQRNNVALETCGWRGGRAFTIGIVADVKTDRNLLGWLKLQA